MKKTKRFSWLVETDWVWSGVDWAGCQDRLGQDISWPAGRLQTGESTQGQSDTNTGLLRSQEAMAANSEAEFRMMFLLNNMDINQEGQLSSEDRLFSSGTPRYQSENSQVNKT